MKVLITLNRGHQSYPCAFVLRWFFVIVCHSPIDVPKIHRKWYGWAPDCVLYSPWLVHVRNLHLGGVWFFDIWHRVKLDFLKVATNRLIAGRIPAHSIIALLVHRWGGEEEIPNNAKWHINIHNIHNGKTDSPFSGVVTFFWLWRVACSNMCADFSLPAGLPWIIKSELTIWEIYLFRLENMMCGEVSLHQANLGWTQLTPTLWFISNSFDSPPFDDIQFYMGGRNLWKRMVWGWRPGLIW